MVVIENDGEVELGALTLLGASTKDGDSTKIGFFGSGNKYAMATLLRNGIAFEIWSGLKKIEVTTDKVYLKGQEYDRIVLDGNATSLTTRMGPDWEIWFALREFICNAKDEGGYRLTDVLIPEEGKTKIQIADNREEIRDVIQNIEQYILSETKPLEVVQTYKGEVQILPNYKEKFNVYRKGISVVGKTESRSLFHYNMENLSINEARTFSDYGEVRTCITVALLACTEREIIEAYIRNCFNKDLVENNLPFEYVWQVPSDTWKEVLKDKYCASEKFRDFIPREDRLSMVFLPDGLSRTIHTYFEDTVFVGGRNKAGFVEALEIPKVMKEKVETALAFLSNQGLQFDNSKIYYGKFSQPMIIAMYGGEEGAIYLSVDHADDSQEEVEATLLEEILHSLGYDDGTRNIELWLMRNLVSSWHKEVQ